MQLIVPYILFIVRKHPSTPGPVWDFFMNLDEFSALIEMMIGFLLFKHCVKLQLASLLLPESFIPEWKPTRLECTVLLMCS